MIHVLISWGYNKSGKGTLRDQRSVHSANPTLSNGETMTAILNSVSN